MVWLKSSSEQWVPGYWQWSERNRATRTAEHPSAVADLDILHRAIAAIPTAEIPAEIIARIFTVCAGGYDQYALANAALVCRRWSDLAAETLWQRVVVHSKKVGDFCRFVHKTNSRIAEHAISVCVSGDPADTWEAASQIGEALPHVITMQLGLEALDPVIQRIVVQHDRVWGKMYRRPLDVIPAVHLEKTCRHPTQLSVAAYLAFGLQQKSMAQSFWLWSSLR